MCRESTLALSGVSPPDLLLGATLRHGPWRRMGFGLDFMLLLHVGHASPDSPFPGTWIEEEQALGMVSIGVTLTISTLRLHLAVTQCMAMFVYGICLHTSLGWDLTCFLLYV